ncbi:P-loop containing nucleoside triphosphate hydrolase protein [Microstroma glucosiphilum]|uniref:Mitochondrial Rho GTPase 1 n=1 Tax=Pseudomicrostroma glucosiphilum TaxID=1684307 RepID=A0A316U5W2_9BASI|nr:P-loop containing nucleoside triphosphate hydrolase protein [Pseudomicrostroma glucosiphilum]PWN19851.1 P-loop containing nucleoside triphosphate hydrolase protein [Pseudomicrostroma glucosiphilum]
MTRDIKVTLAGDADVGKSSLVTALVRDSWSSSVQRVVPEILLPADVTETGVSTRIVDTASSPAQRSHLESSLRSSHVIILVYSIEAPASFDRIPTYWLPYIRSLGINVPVILVGNKIDLRTEAMLNTNEALEDELAPVMAEFKEVESCIETSVKEGINVSEVFYFAQKAVLYPTAPLYNSTSHTLKEPCVDALKRIFKLCDSDKDNLLSDDELNDFQRRCFGAPLQQQELEGIKELVLAAPVSSRPSHPDLREGGGRLSTGGRSAASSVSGASFNGDTSSIYSSHYHPHLREGKLTLAGWLHLHTLFIQRGRLETTWAVLTSYGYSQSLTLSPDYLNPPSFYVPSDCSVELSPYGYSFLTDIFEVHDKDRDGALCQEELRELFETAPGGRHPWEGSGFPNTTVTNEHGAVTLQGWLAQWSMTTLLDYKVTLANLAYLGYPNFVLGGGSTAGGAGPSSLGSGQSSGSGSGSSTHTSSPPPTTTALKLTKRNTRRLFSPSSYYPSSSSTSPNNSTSSTQKKKKKKGDPAERSVFLAYVVGPPGSGKSSLLRAMAGKSFQSHYEPTSHTHSVVSAVEQEGGTERYLVLQEFGSRYEGDALRSASRLAMADVILFVWDSSDTNSFSYISNLRQKYPALAGLPSLFVATKADLDLAQQRHEVQPDVYCRKLGLGRFSPMHVSVLEGIPSTVSGTGGDDLVSGVGSAANGDVGIAGRRGGLTELYSVTCLIAQDPRGSGAIPGGGSRRSGSGLMPASTGGKVAAALGLVALLGLAGTGAYFWMGAGGGTGAGSASSGAGGGTGTGAGGARGRMGSVPGGAGAGRIGTSTTKGSGVGVGVGTGALNWLRKKTEL